MKVMQVGPWLAAWRAENEVEPGDLARAWGVTIKRLVDVEAGEDMPPHAAVADYATLAVFMAAFEAANAAAEGRQREPPGVGALRIRRFLYGLLDADRAAWSDIQDARNRARAEQPVERR